MPGISWPRWMSKVTAPQGKGAGSPPQLPLSLAASSLFVTGCVQDSMSLAALAGLSAVGGALTWYFLKDEFRQDKISDLFCKSEEGGDRQKAYDQLRKIAAKDPRAFGIDYVDMLVERVLKKGDQGAIDVLVALGRRHSYLKMLIADNEALPDWKRHPVIQEILKRVS